MEMVMNDHHDGDDHYGNDDQDDDVDPTCPTGRPLQAVAPCCHRTPPSSLSLRNHDAIKSSNATAFCVVFKFLLAPRDPVLARHLVPNTSWPVSSLHRQYPAPSGHRFLTYFDRLKEAINAQSVKEKERFIKQPNTEKIVHNVFH